MALFNRKKNQNQSVLPELDKYYEGERKERTGLAWVLAIFSVLIVATFIILLFLAGRWAYRELTTSNDSEDVTVSETQEGDKELPTFDGSSNDQAVDEEGSSPESQADNREEQSEDRTREETEGSVDAPARTETPSDPSAGYQPIPSTGDSPLPNTGPADTLAVFIVATLLAGGFYRLVLPNKK